METELVECPQCGQAFEAFEPLGYTINRAADLLGKSPAAVRAHIRRGNLPARKIQRVWYIRPGDLDAFRPRPIGRPRRA